MRKSFPFLIALLLLLAATPKAQVALPPYAGFQKPAAAGISTVDPGTLASLRLWQRARSESYANNDAVGTITDYSGLGRNFTQSTASKKPTFLTSQINGQPAFSFDGVDDETTNATALSNYITNSAYTVWAVISVTSAGAAGANYLAASAISDSGGYWGLRMRPSALRLLNHNYTATDDAVSVNITANTWYLVEMRHESGSIYISLNGGTDASATSGNTAVLSGTLMQGKSYAGVFVQCKSAELIVCNAAIGSTDRAGVRAYLNNIYAIY